MGAITQAMARSGRAHGVEYRTSAPVERILMEGGRAVGVRIEDGEEFRARFLLANTDPKRTFLRFVGREHLPAAPPFVLCANHASHLDALALAAPLRLDLRDRVFALAAGDVFFESAVPTAFRSTRATLSSA